MFFYLLIVPSSAVLLLTIFELQIVQKHDKVLFSYCQLRRNILSFLRADGLKLSEYDYKLTSRMLEYVGVTIHDFSTFKKEVFNFRKAKKLIKASARAQHRKDVFVQTNNGKITDLQDQFRFCIIKSVFAYTPFLMSEVGLQLIYSMGKLLVKAGAKKGKNILKYVDVFRGDIEWLNKPEHRYDLFNRNPC